MEVKKRGRYWAVLDDKGRLVCVAIFRKGVLDVIRKRDTKGEKCNVYQFERYR